MVRQRLSVYGATGWGELYDLDQDPLEINNVSDLVAAAGADGSMAPSTGKRAR